MPAVMRASAAVERAGVPAVAIGATGFEGMGRAVGRAMGISHVPIVVYPGVIPTDTSDVFREMVRSVVAPEVERALTQRIEDETSGPAPQDNEPAPRDIVFSGGLDEMQEEFLERQWSDGLPVVPPTIDRVQKFLAQTERDPDEVIGLLLPERREATVWNVAVNGVMAGCRPEYMPVLLAAIECVADRNFKIEDAGSTPGWEPLVIVSGAIVDELNFNSGTGVMRVGRQANTSIGRFMRLFMRNVAGLRIPPGSTDQGAIAGSFHVVLAENGSATNDLGWPTFGQDRGHRAGDSIVGVQSVVSVSPPIYTGGEQAQDHLATLNMLFMYGMGPWAYTSIRPQSWHPLLVLGPSVARALHGFGVSKHDIRQYFFEHARLPARVLERYARQVGGNAFDLARLVAAGQIPAHYALSDDPERPIPMMPSADCLSIVIAGNPSRNQSRAYINNHSQGALVTRPVRPRQASS